MSESPKKCPHRPPQLLAACCRCLCRRLRMSCLNQVREGGRGVVACSVTRCVVGWPSLFRSMNWLKLLTVTVLCTLPGFLIRGRTTASRWVLTRVVMVCVFLCVCVSANLDKQTDRGNTALHYCCLTDNSECLKLLLRGKASVSISKNTNWTINVSRQL